MGKQGTYVAAVTGGPWAGSGEMQDSRDTAMDVGSSRLPESPMSLPTLQVGVSHGSKAEGGFSSSVAS